MIVADRTIDRDYRAIIEGLRAFLEKVQAEMDSREKGGVDRLALFRSYQQILFEKLNISINGLEIVASDFDEKAHKVNKEFLQREIHPIALKAPFNDRCFNKPLGYPGDYMTMEMIYSSPYVGSTAFVQLLNLHSLTLPIARAVRHRYTNIEKMIKETVRENPKATIFSVGSGPAWEVRQFLREAGRCDARFYLLDQDSEALAFVSERLEGYANSVYLLNEGVARLIRGGLATKFDFIYSMGLFDYLPDSFAKKLIYRLTGLLREGGRLVIGNASFNPNRIWMEHGSDWYLIYRNRDELLRLADRVASTAKRVYVEQEEALDQMFLFLMIEV